jgi:hypothetical protein
MRLSAFAASPLAAALLFVATAPRAEEPEAEPSDAQGVPETIVELSPDGFTAEAGLLHDISKIVESKQTTGWLIDRYELEKMMGDALSSVCRAPEEARQAALAQCEQAIVTLGGPLEKAYRENGGSLDGLSDLVFATRVRDLLAEAITRAPADCPAWIPPDPEFKGLQTDAGRFTLELEGGGLFVYHDKLLGGGGSGRVLGAYGLSQHWSVLAGGEFGGAALFKQGDGGTEFPIEFVFATPVVLRLLDLTWHYDLEAAPVVFLQDGSTNVGVRAGVLLGISTLRIRGIMPWAGIGFAAERYFDGAERDGFLLLKGGARVGLDWDL